MYNPEYAQIYDWETRLICGEREDEIKYWLQTARKYGSRVLELGAGSGWMTIPLLQSGCRVSALDNSEEMLKILQKKAAANACDKELTIIHGDMERFDLENRFDLCIIPYSSFQFLANEKAQQNCINNVYKCLRCGGVLCFDIDAEILCEPENLQPTELYREYNDEYEVQISMRTSWETDEKTGIRYWKDKYVVTDRDGRRRSFVNEIALRSVSKDAVDEILCSCGFARISVMGDYDGSEYLEGNSPRILTQYIKKA